MLRRGLISIAMIAALQGICFGQGFLDSILGPGGLGLWSSGDAASRQYKNPQMQGGVQGTTQQPYQQPAASGQQQIPYPPAGAQAYQQSYPGKGDGYPQQGYSYQQQGVYEHPQNYPPAPMGAKPQQYSATPESSAPQQYQAPQQYAAPPFQSTPERPGQAAPGQSSLRPRQYAPDQAPVTADVPPRGAARTTTAEGAWVQYYPPADEPEALQRTVQRPPRQLRHKPDTAEAQSVKRTQPRERNTSGTQSPGSSAMGMPKPDEIPRSLDPRYGWDAAVNRGPLAPATR